MTLADHIEAELTRLDEAPPNPRHVQPPAARLRRLGWQLAVPCTGVVDGVDVRIVVADFDRVVIVEDATGVRMQAPIASVRLSTPPRWRRVRPDSGFGSGVRGRERALQRKRELAELD